MRFSDQPIIRKTRIMTAAVTLAFIAALIFSFGTYWVLGSRRSVEESVSRNVREASVSIDSELRSIAESFVSIFGTEEFSYEMADMTAPNADMTRNRVFLQDELMTLASSNRAIVSALILDCNTGEVYSLFRDAIIASRAQVLWNSELQAMSGIMVLPERPSPIRGQETIIPMAFPLEMRYGCAVISQGRGELVAIVLLSPDFVRSLLSEGGVLADSRGHIITMNGQSEGPLPSYPGASRHGRIFSYAESLPFSGLLASAGADLHEAMRRVFGTAAASITAAVALLIIFVAVFSRMLRRYVTLPIGKLKAAVMKIENGNYSGKADFTGSDELGELRDAISRMAETIERQIGEIREEEEKQTKTEMRLLSEQLTPHFLYNTLECIQQEIQTGNSTASAEMTRALSLYLRTVLSYGSETISIKDEIRHDMSYIRIMNGRFRKDIIYQHTEDAEMQDEQILKMVLQPFIENSIKHGFGIGDVDTWVQQPEISTSFRYTDGRIRIEITDNGKGFDEDELIALMHGEAEGGHIGIRNTYLRLLKFYGEENVAVNVSSIPYFQSSIIIEVPALAGRNERLS